MSLNDSENEVPALQKEDIDLSNDPFTVPDGGLKAWTTIFGASLILLCTFGYVYSFGVYTDFYVRVYLSEHSPSSIAWIGSVQLMLPFALGVVSGKLFDMGFFHHLEITGGLLFVFCLFMLSLTKPHHYAEVFLAQGLGAGIGLGLTFVPAVSIVAHHFRRRRGLASGFVFSGIGVGGIIFPIMLNHLIPKLGFPDAVRATAYLVLGLLAIGNLLMRTRLPARRGSDVPKPDIKSFLRDIPYMMTVVGGLFASLGVYFPILYLQLYAVQHDVGANLAFYSLAIINGCSIFGRITANYIADHYGSFNMQVTCTLITSATIWAVLGINSSVGLVFVSIFYGIFSGAWLALSFPCLASLSKSPNEIGARVGLNLALSSVGSLVSSPIQGALLTSEFHWIRPIAFSGTMMAVSAVFAEQPECYLPHSEELKRFEMVE